MEKIHIKLFKDSFFYTISGVAIQGINFIALPIFIRIMSTEQIGKVMLFNTWSALLAIFMSLQCSATISIASVNYEDDLDSYIFNLFFILMIGFLFFISILNLNKDYILKFLNIDVKIMWLIIIQAFGLSLINIKTNEYIYKGNINKKLLISFEYIFLNIFLSLYFINYFFDNNKEIGRIAGIVLSTSLIGAYIIITILKKIKKIEKEKIIFCLKLAIPLAIQSLAHLSLGSIDRIMIQKYVGYNEVGIYGFIYNIGMLVNIIWGNINNAWAPWYFSRLKVKKYAEIKKISKIYLRGFTIIILILLLLLPMLVLILGKKQYNSGLEYLPLIILGCYFNFLYMFPVNYEYFSKQTIYIAVSTVSSAILNIILNLYFIPKYKGNGAAFTTLVSYFSMFLFHEIVVRRRLKHIIFSKKEYFINIFTVTLCSLIIIFFINKYI